ncbi:hypothetical protein [Weissella confusa]|uniref:hypothetical protein n=1 Tax=Weissella confusa TaxID=1583 RepID=UPI00107FB8EA|nr:hypothetical protein [Weissella confusa]TGE71878.1 hypothetical protein C6P10_10910 [Weissella confusa]
MHININDVKDLPAIGSFGRYGILATGADKSNYFNKGPYTEANGYPIQNNFNRWVGFFTGGTVNGAVNGDGTVDQGNSGCSTGGGGAVKFAEDGAGDEGSVTNGQRWSVSSLPGQIRQYISNQFLNGQFSSWWNQRSQNPADWGNCTDLTFAAMAYIWGSDKYNYSYSFPGRGKRCSNST